MRYMYNVDNHVIGIAIVFYSLLGSASQCDLKPPYIGDGGIVKSPWIFNTSPSV